MTVDHWKGAVPVAAAKAVAGDAGAGGVGAADVGVSQGTVAPPAGNAAVVWDAGAVAVSLQGAATLPAAAECQFLPVSACVGAYFSALAHRIAWSAQHYPTPWLRDSFVCSSSSLGGAILLFFWGGCEKPYGTVSGKLLLGVLMLDTSAPSSLKIKAMPIIRMGKNIS